MASAPDVIPDIFVTVTFNPEGYGVKQVLSALAESGEPLTADELWGGRHVSNIVAVDATPFVRADSYQNGPIAQIENDARRLSLLDAMAARGMVVKTKRGRWALPA